MIVEQYKIPVVSCVVFDKINQTLLLQHRIHEGEDNNKWTFCGGKIRINETISEAARREMYEETGLLLIQQPPLPLIGATTQSEWLILFVLITEFAGVATNREPHKIDKYDWVDYRKLSELDLTPGMIDFNTKCYNYFVHLIKREV